MPSEPISPGGPDPMFHTGISEVRYSLPILLKEIQLERTASSFAMEKLDQVEIGKLFAKKRPRRAIKPGK